MEPRRPKHKQAPPLEVSTTELESALRRRAAYRFPDSDTERVAFPSAHKPEVELEVIHTHMSMVFRLPERVYKIKKPVNFGFADFSTLYKRFQACFAEVQLNQRLAPGVYQGVVPISMQRDSRELCVRCDDFWTPEKSADLDYWLNDDFGEIVEWAVHMVRLPDDHTLLSHMGNGHLTEQKLDQVADTLVAFHADARRGPRIDRFGQEDVVRANVDQNFEQTQGHVDVTVSAPVYARVKQLSYGRLTQLTSSMADRVANGYVCDCHGDLRLEHVYLLPSSWGTDVSGVDEGAEKLMILDCIEFNEQFRFGDPLADVAFLIMDIWRQGRPDLARYLQRQYLLKAGQDSAENAQLVAFYVAYRAVVRAKVSGFRVLDATLSPAQRAQETQRARCCWLVALELLSPPAERSCMLFIAGLPASGKSNLAEMLANNERGMLWLRADAVRKELAAADQKKTLEDASMEEKGNFQEGLYSPEMTQRTYAEMLARAVTHVRQGKRVVLDATFRDAQQRQQFVATARSEGVLFAFVVCECDREIVRGRLLARKDTLSDATWEVFEAMERVWSFPELESLVESRVVNTEKERELTLRRAQVFLRQLGLL